MTPTMPNAADLLPLLPELVLVGAAFALLMLVVVPVPALSGTPIEWFPGGGALSAGLSPALNP